MRPNDAASLRPGQVINVHRSSASNHAGNMSFRIEAELGRGGFGVVYRAIQLPLGRAVALKMLTAEALATGPEGLARFRREAELSQRLSHPNTVRLYDVGATEQGLPFIAWELLRGRSVGAALEKDGPMPPARVAHIAKQALRSLAEAHALGVIHRDLKPENLFLCDFTGEPDFVKVLDFGIAKSLVSNDKLTREGLMVGTPTYMAPEQVTGQPIDGRTDLYALGLVMAELLTGRAVFYGDSALAICMAQASDAPAPLSQNALGSPLGSILARATQKPPSLRFSSAAEMLDAIERAFAEQVTVQAPFVATPVMVRPAVPSMSQAATAMTPRGAPPLASPGPRTLPMTPAPLARNAPPAAGNRALWVALVVLVAALGVGGTLTALIATGALSLDDRPPPPGRGDPGPVHISTPLAPPIAIGRHFATLDFKQLHARLASAKLTLTHEDHYGDTWTFQTDNEIIERQKMIDADAAMFLAQVSTNTGLTAVAVDGAVVLMVSSTNLSSARATLDRILPP
jgi:serine/threonine-protein kinase